MDTNPDPDWRALDANPYPIRIRQNVAYPIGSVYVTLTLSFKWQDGGSVRIQILFNSAHKGLANVMEVV